MALPERRGLHGATSRNFNIQWSAVGMIYTSLNPENMYSNYPGNCIWGRSVKSLDSLKYFGVLRALWLQTVFVFLNARRKYYQLFRTFERGCFNAIICILYCKYLSSLKIIKHSYYYKRLRFLMKENCLSTRLPYLLLT